jgi:alpha-1,3-rhamnosyl/mannosyltransferase
MLQAIAAEPGRGGLAYHMCGSREPGGDPPPLVDLPLFRPPIPRRLLHAAWTEVGRPGVDRFVGRPDLLHVLYPSCPVPSRAPVIYTVHDLMPLTTPEWFAHRERRMFEKAIRDAARRAELLIAVSDSIAVQIRDRLGVEERRIRVVPLGVSGAFAATPPDETVAAVCRRHGVETGRYVIVVGAVSTRKNPGAVIASLASVGDLRLVMAGPPGTGSDQVVDDVRKRGLTDRVRITGWLPRDELAALVAGAVALVHPSLDEGFGMTPLEAMAAGVPAIVSDAGALPATVGDAACVVPAGDPDAWATALQKVTGDAAARADLIVKGRSRAAQFTWARTARETIDVYLASLGE